MDQAASDSYLEAQVMTATPQKLRLMLIDGAIAAARQVLVHWEADQHDEAAESVIRCREIVAELLAGIQLDESELTKRVASVYVFLFQLFTEAQLRRDGEAIEKAIEILLVERETWRLVCEQMPSAPVSPAGEDSPAQEITAADAERTLANHPHTPQAGANTPTLELDA